MPLSNSSNDAWGGFAVTMIDALDTAHLLGFHAEFDEFISSHNVAGSGNV